MSSSKDGSIIGQKGVQYGLQKPALALGARGGLAAGRGAAARPAAARPVTNVFGDDDSDDDVEAQVARQAEKKKAAAKVRGRVHARLERSARLQLCRGLHLCALSRHLVDLTRCWLAHVWPQVQEAYAQALADDPTVFDYDGV